MSAMSPGGMYPSSSSNLGGSNPYASMYQAVLTQARRGARPGYFHTAQDTPDQIARANSAWDSGDPHAYDQFEHDAGMSGDIAGAMETGPYAGLFSFGDPGLGDHNASQNANPWAGAVPAGAGYAPGTYKLADGSYSAGPAGGIGGSGPGGGSYGSQYGGGSMPGGGTPRLGGLGGGGASLGGGGGGSSGGFAGTLEGAYGRIINNPTLFSPEEEAGITNRATGTIARGEQDALDSADQEALQRGDTNGATASTDRARIRGQGAAQQAETAANIKTGLKSADRQSLLAALGGGAGLMQGEGNLALGAGELNLKNQEFGLQEMQLLQQMLGKGGMSPEMLAAFANQGV